ncbi:AsmA family protein [Planktotalea sp.]|uniref:AsmA family protein n=1 Tax=Planktotalea sp. TaxID=2029877 RepID=UPI003F6B51DE
MRFLIRLILIVVVAIAIAIVGLLMLPGEKIAHIAADQLSKQTGRAVSISSETSISLYPTLGVTTGPASIASSDWAKNGPLLTSDSLAIGIDVPALIAGTIRITKLEAKSPNIVLERAADGRMNWDLLPNSDTSDEPVASETSEEQNFDLSLEQALITSGSLRYIAHETSTDQTLKNVDIDLRWPSLGGPADLILGVTPFNDRISLNTTVADVMGLIGGEQTTLSGNLNAAGADLAFEGIASIKPEAAMQLNGTIPQVGALMRALGQEPSAFGLDSDFNPSARINSQVSFDGTRLALRKIALGLDDSSVSGDADIVIALGAPQVTAKLEADVKNAGQLMRMLGQAPEQFGLDAAFNPNLKSNIALSMSGDDLNAQLTGVNATLDGSSVAGKGAIILKSGVPNITLNIDADVKNAGQLMRTLGQAPEKFDLDAAFNPDLKSAVALSMNGSDISANLTGLTASLEDTRISGDANIALRNSVPAVTANLAVNLPNVARAAALVGQPLSNFGLSANAAPSLKSNINARIQGSNVTANLRDLSATLAGASLSGAIDLALSGSTPNVSGTINANVPSTANLMRALGQGAPDLPKGFGQAISASTGLSFKSNQLDLTGLKVSLDQNTLTGGVSVNLAGSVPNINASLQAGNLDLSALNPDDDTSSESSAGSGWSKDPIDASALSALNGNINLKASSINLGKIKLGAADLGVSIDRARAVVSINDLNAYQGRFGGQLVANNRNGLSVGGDLRANSIALGPLLTALADTDKISGNGNLNLKFLGVGNSLDAIMRSLSGNIAMSVPQGEIAGIDLEGLIRQGNANARRTSFENLQASGVLKDGNLRNDDLSAKTGRVEARGEGNINLGAQTIDYLLTPVVNNVGEQDRIEIPVRIKGPWANVSVRPDLQAALNLENERKKLEEQARQEIEREKQKLRDKAEAEKAKLRAQAQAEAKKLEDRAKAKVEEAARKAAQRAADKLKLDQAQQQRLQDAAKGALERELGNGLRNLLGGN